MIELYDGAAGPESAADLLAQDYLAGTFQQHQQDLEGLIRQTNSCAAFTQFARTHIQVKRPKTNGSGGVAAGTVAFHFG